MAPFSRGSREVRGVERQPETGGTWEEGGRTGGGGGRRKRCGEEEEEEREEGVQGEGKKEGRMRTPRRREARIGARRTRRGRGVAVG